MHKVSSPLKCSQPEDCEVGTQRARTSLVSHEWCVLSFTESGTLHALLILVLHAPPTVTIPD